jgi:hypothetical protein
MKSPLKIIAAIVFVLGINLVARAKEWRGIVPLHSTRADVERLLGPPAHNFATARSLYVVDHADVEIVFADQSLPNSEYCPRKVPLGTVLSIVLLPKGEVALSDLEIDPKRAKTLSFEHPDYRAYYDDEAGFLVSVLNGKVSEIWYLGNGKDRSLCSRYYRNPKHFVEIRVDDF